MRVPFSPTAKLASHKLPPSSKAWLARQFRDPLVRERLSHPAQYRSRSAFKLLELDQKWRFLCHPDVKTVVDLGAAPGGWSQVVAGKLGWTIQDVVGSRKLSERMKSKKGKGKEYGWGDAVEEDGDDGFGLKDEQRGEYGSWSSAPSPSLPSPQEDDPLDILYSDMQSTKGQLKPPSTPPVSPKGRGTIVALDLLPIWPIPGVKTLQMDFLSPEADDYISALLSSDPTIEGKADVILSDMAANFTGNRIHDIESSLDICNAVFKFAQRHLRTSKDVGRSRGGVLLLKHFEHPHILQFRKDKLEPNFHTVNYIKPDASRSDSSEGYFLCMGWRPQK